VLLLLLLITYHFTHYFYPPSCPSTSFVYNTTGFVDPPMDALAGRKEGVAEGVHN
jgi:hypothetical protein